MVSRLNDLKLEDLNVVCGFILLNEKSCLFAIEKIRPVDCMMCDMNHLIQSNARGLKPVNGVTMRVSNETACDLPGRNL